MKKKPTCVSPGVSTAGEDSAWRLAADQSCAAWRAIRADLPLLHPQALKAAEQCSDRFWPSVEESIIIEKKKNPVSTLLCSTWTVFRSIFYRLWDFLGGFTVKPHVFGSSIMLAVVGFGCRVGLNGSVWPSDLESQDSIYSLEQSTLHQFISRVRSSAKSFEW